MIIIYHKDNKVVEVSHETFQQTKNGAPVINFILEQALKFPDEIVVWCHFDLKENLNIGKIQKLASHKKSLLSYNPSELFLGKGIGYVEESPFINVNPKKTYPTWQMSSAVGVAHASLFLSIGNTLSKNSKFDYYLNSLAKLAMPLGLFCYSEPKLLSENTKFHLTENANAYELFRFVKQHYKTRWTFLLFFNFMVYESKFPLLPFLLSIFYKKRNNRNIKINGRDINPLKENHQTQTLDVIIPTIGREKYLHDFLVDLESQSFLPKNVIIVEQNPDMDSTSQLDFVTSKTWNFNIKHIFTHRTGACNARNVAFKEVTSDWVFFADDDIRIESDFIRKTFEEINKFDAKAVSIACLQKNENQHYSNVFQWNSFGSGCSFVFYQSAKDCIFKPGYEFGFGEDADFGMQLRNHGCDILYLPAPKILHLKAPVGGFRTVNQLEWANDKIQPKPSPTIMLYFLSNYTENQLHGYKTTLFFKYYSRQKIKNPFQYYKVFQQQWKQSHFWANKLKHKTA